METHYLPYDTKNMGNWGREGVLAENISLEQHVYNGCMRLTAVLTFFSPLDNCYVGIFCLISANLNFHNFCG